MRQSQQDSIMLGLELFSTEKAPCIKSNNLCPVEGIARKEIPKLDIGAGLRNTSSFWEYRGWRALIR